MLIELQTIAGKDTEQGAISIVEAAKVLPFRVERTYHTYGVKAGAIRGYHAHKKLMQFLICVRGAINVVLDNGSEKREFLLDQPSIGLLVRPEEWHTMEWLKDDSVLMVLASSGYDEGDYIRDYEEFLKFAAEAGRDR